MFSLGILATIAIVGALTAAAGRMLGDLGPVVNYGVAAIFFAVGLHLLGVFELPFGGPKTPGSTGHGTWAAFILGLVFGLALGPCTFAFMAPVLAATVKVGGEQPILAGSLLLSYGIGHCAVIVAAGASTGWVQRYLDWSASSRGPVILRRVCGVLVILGGLYLIYAAP
jgi:cytochrome c-type biogenesis protein